MGAYRSRLARPVECNGTSWAATRIARHEQAVANTLRWAREAADDGDFADALSWVRVLESIGEPLSEEDKARRDEWRVGLEAEPPVLADRRS